MSGVYAAIFATMAAGCSTPTPPPGIGLPASGAVAEPSAYSAPSPLLATAAPPVAHAGSSTPPPSERRVVCGPSCPRGTACHLTKNGPSCVACAPGSLPTCKDDRFVAKCDEDGTLKPTTDCTVQKKHCVDGRCVGRECEPNATHCYEGDVYKCNDTGTGRTLVTRCILVEADGSLDGSKVCQVRKGGPACQEHCTESSGTILALRDCEACSWDNVPFCATESPERGCSDWICGEGSIGFGVVSIPCWRETDGAVVPNSNRVGACEGEGPIGTRTVSYEVCRGGAAVSATRVEPCQK